MSTQHSTAATANDAAAATAVGAREDAVRMMLTAHMCTSSKEDDSYSDKALKSLFSPA